jgi:hypothetical protein
MLTSHLLPGGLGQMNSNCLQSTGLGQIGEIMSSSRYVLALLVDHVCELL